MNQITAYCRFACKSTLRFYKQTIIFSSINDTISWPSNQLKISDTKNIQPLQFKCTVELLQVHTNDNYIDFLSRTPITIPSSLSEQWDVHQNILKAFLTSEPGQIYYHPNNIMNMFCLSCSPNGTINQTKGPLLLSLELIRLSPNISFIECDFQLNSNHKSIKLSWQSQGAVFSYNQTKRTWPAHLFLHSSLSLTDELSFTVDINITKIGDVYGKKIKKSHWGQYGIMHAVKHAENKPSNVSHEHSWSIEAVTSRSNISSTHNTSPQSYTKIPLIQSKTTNIYNIENSYNPYKYQQFEQPTRSKTWNQETIADNPISHTTKISKSNRKKHHTQTKFRVEQMQQMDADDSDNYSMDNKSASDLNRYPFGFHHDQHPRRYVRKMILNQQDEYEPLSLKEHESTVAKSMRTKRSHSPYMMQNELEEHKYDILYENNDSDGTLRTSKSRNRGKLSQLRSDSNSKGSVLHAKFVAWLYNVVQLEQYLTLFEENGKADIRKIRHFKNKMLLDMGIEDDADRELILEEVEEFKTLQAEFENILDQNKILKPLRSKFRANGILTINDLHVDIRRKTDLQRILNVSNNDKIEQIWNIIHPSQSNLQLKINKIKKKYNLTVSYMDSLFRDLNELQVQMSATNVFTNNSSIQKQHSKILNDYALKLKNQRMIVSKFMNSNGLKATEANINMQYNSNSNVKKLNATLNKCAAKNPTLTNELCNIIAQALKEETSQTVVESALNRMGTIETQQTNNTIESDYSFPKTLNYTYDHLESNQCIPLIEDQNSNQNHSNNHNHNHISDDDDEKVDKVVVVVDKIIDNPFHNSNSNIMHYSPRNKPK